MDYAPYYCEENIWKYLGKLSPAARARAWAAFIFGLRGTVAVRGQKTGRPPDGLALWDYHVIALEENASGRLDALDFDAARGFRIDAREYLETAFPPEFRSAAAVKGVSPLFRLLPAEGFAGRFSSDRSHMRSFDGLWLQPPPDWDPPSGGSAADVWKLSDLLQPDAPGMPPVLSLEEMAEIIR